MEADGVEIWWAWGWRVDIFSTLSHVVDGLTDSNIVQKLLLSGESPKHIVMLLPLQGATAPTRGTQGVASLALGWVLHWAFSPYLQIRPIAPQLATKSYLGSTMVSLSRA